MTPRTAAMLCAGLLLCAVARGGDETPGIRLFLPEVLAVEELSDEKSGKAFALLGPVEIAVDGAAARLFSVRARRLVVWLDPAFDSTIFSLVKRMKQEPDLIPLWAVRAIYAEGGRVPAVFQTTGRIFRCASFYFDFTTHQGLIVDADLRYQLPGGGAEDLPDVVMRARKVHVTGPGKMVAEESAFFASEYYEPDVSITASRVTIEEREVAEVLGKLIRLSKRPAAGEEGVGGPTRAEIDALLKEVEEAGRSRQGRLMVAEDVRARVLGVPLLRFPKVRSDGDSPPLRVAVEVGGKGTLSSGGKIGLGLDTRPVSWIAGFGYYDGRGPLFDFEAETLTEDGRFLGRTYGVYLHDDGDDRGILPSTRNRYWIKNQYRWLASDRWRLDAEFSDLSDSRWLRNFDEREFKEEKEQETLLHLRRRDELGYFTFTGKVQSIGFLDTVEELPRAGIAYPVFTLFRLAESADGEPIALQLGLTAEAGNLSFRDGDGLDAPDFRTSRLDVDPVLYLSFDAGPVRVVPFASFRATIYEDELSGGSLGRFAGSAGVRMDTQLARSDGGMRRVLNLSVEYIDLYEVSESAGLLFPFDNIDLLTPFERLGARVRHRWIRAGRTLLDVELLAAWFPEGRQPFGVMGDGLLELDARWRPTVRSRVLLRAQVDPEEGQLDTGSIEHHWQVSDPLALLLGLRHIEGDSDILTGQVELLVDDRWRIVAFGQYDFRASESLDQALLIQRLGQTLIVGVRLSYDPGDNDFSFGIKFDLLESFRRHRSKREEYDARGELGWR